MFNTSFLDNVPERPSDLLEQVKKGDQVIVCEEDSVMGGEHRGDGAFWYSMGSVVKVSRKHGYILVGYVSRYGRDFRRRFAPNGYPLDERGAAVSRHRIGWYGGIVLLSSLRLLQRICHQELVDQIARKGWKDWERLDGSMLESLGHLLEIKREEAISEALSPGRSSLSVFTARIGTDWNTWKVWLEDRPEVSAISEIISFAITDLLRGLKLPRIQLSSGLAELHYYLKNHPERVVKALIGKGMDILEDDTLFDRVEIGRQYTDPSAFSNVCQFVPTRGTLILLDRMGDMMGSGELYALVFDDSFHLYEVRRLHGDLPMIQEVQFAELLAPSDQGTYRVVYTKTVNGSGISEKEGRLQ